MGVDTRSVKLSKSNFQLIILTCIRVLQMEEASLPVSPSEKGEG